MLMRQPFDTERIFLATEKNHYDPGDLITVHGLLSAANQSNRQPYSWYIYIECISSQDSVILQKKITCDKNGYFNINIATHSLWPASIYYLRAYTQLMQNYEPESLTMLPVLIGTMHPQKPEEVREVYARMFPESGRLLTNFRQNILFDLSDNNGFPILPDQVQLVTHDKDTVIRQIKVSDQGMGQFSFQPTQDKQHHLQVEYNNRLFRFPVEASDLGTALQATINRNRLTVHLFGLQQTTVYHLFIYHAAIGLKEIPFHSGQQAMMIDLSAYPKGIYTLFLTDATYHLLNERSLWLPTNEATLVTCQLTSTSYSGGTKLNYQLTAPDSSTVLARIVPNYDLFTLQAYPNVQFGNELISPKRFPFIESQDWITHKEEIDQWLQTAHFALFDIEKLFNDENTHSYVAEDVMLLKGVAKDKEHKPLKENIIINVENRKDQLYYSGVTDEKGHFAIPVDNFSEGAPFLLSAQNRKGNNIACTFTLDTNKSPLIVIPYLHFSETQLPSNTQMNNQLLPYSMDEKPGKGLSHRQCNSGGS